MTNIVKPSDFQRSREEMQRERLQQAADGWEQAAADLAKDYNAIVCETVILENQIKQLQNEFTSLTATSAELAKDKQALLEETETLKSLIEDMQLEKVNINRERDALQREHDHFQQASKILAVKNKEWNNLNKLRRLAYRKEMRTSRILYYVVGTLMPLYIFSWLIIFVIYPQIFELIRIRLLQLFSYVVSMFQ